MNPLLNQLQPYPFARLREAMRDWTTPAGLQPVHLQIGEPKHATPKIITDALAASLTELSKYPLTAGLPELRQACANWAARRYQGVELNPDTEILPVLGSREALFSFVQALLNPVSDGLKPVVVSPNPFYQIYEGAALLVQTRLAQHRRKLVAAHPTGFRLLAQQSQRQRAATGRLEGII